MEKLEKDLRHFKQELQTENNQYRRNLILEEIRKVEQAILDRILEQKAQLDRENRLMQKWLDKHDEENK